MKVARAVDIPWRENNFFKVEKIPLSVTENHERNRTRHYVSVRTATIRSLT